MKDGNNIVNRKEYNQDILVKQPKPCVIKIQTKIIIYCLFPWNKTWNLRDIVICDQWGNILLVAYCCFWNVHFKITHRRSRIWLDCNGSSNKRQIRERVFGPKGYCSRERISKLLAESQKIQNIPNQWKFNVIGHTEKRKEKKTPKIRRNVNQNLPNTWW